MAANLGESALASVQQEGLDQVLSELTDYYPGRDNDAHSFRVPALDSLLEVFAASKSQYQSRRAFDQDQLRDYQATAYDEMLMQDENEPNESHGPNATHGQDDTSAADVLFPGHDETEKRSPPILEVSSSLSSSGKSQMLYYLTAIAILPREYGGFAVGGHEAAVVFIDTDDRFDAERLRLVARVD